MLDRMADIYLVFISTVCFTLLLRYLLQFYCVKRRAPGPWGFPIVGHIPLFGAKPTKTFKKWRNEYGDVFRIRLGSWNTVVLNGLSTIKEALERPGDVLSSRPNFVSTQMIRKVQENEGFPFAPFNEAYLKQRKLTAKALRKFTHIRNHQVEDLICHEVEKLAIDCLQCKGIPLDISETITLSSGVVIYNVLIGNDDKGDDVRNDESFQQYIKSSQDFVEFVGSASAIDALPWLRFILRDKAAKFAQFAIRAWTLLQPKIQQHRETFDINNLQDVTDVFLAANLPQQVNDKTVEITERRQLHTLDHLFGAGFETVSTTLKWAILYMTAYPEVQRKVQFEIDTIVGNCRSVTVADKARLHYTQATILETLRASCIAHLAIPRSTLTETKINGFDIDKDTVIIMNLHSISHDASLWENPEEFKPERHLDTNGMLDKRSPVVQFGLGRRRCVGEHLARNELFLYFSLLLQRLTFEKPKDDYLDLEPVAKLVNTPKPFRVVVKGRTQFLM